MCYRFCSFTATPTTEISTLSLHDALPISPHPRGVHGHTPHRHVECHAPGLGHEPLEGRAALVGGNPSGDRKSTRLNSSHTVISYAVFCLKKKKTNKRCNNMD